MRLPKYRPISGNLRPNSKMPKNMMIKCSVGPRPNNPTLRYEKQIAIMAAGTIASAIMTKN